MLHCATGGTSPTFFLTLCQCEQQCRWMKDSHLAHHIQAVPKLSLLTAEDHADDAGTDPRGSLLCRTCWSNKAGHPPAMGEGINNKSNLYSFLQKHSLWNVCFLRHSCPSSSYTVLRKGYFLHKWLSRYLYYFNQPPMEKQIEKVIARLMEGRAVAEHKFLHSEQEDPWFDDQHLRKSKEPGEWQPVRSDKIGLDRPKAWLSTRELCMLNSAHSPSWDYRKSITTRD